MRLPRVRFTVRRLMVAVAAVALAIFGVQMGLRRAEYLERLRWVEGAELQARRAADIKLDEKMAALDKVHDRAYFLKMAEHHAARKRIYQYASSHPWMSVPPGPFEPGGAASE
jgi:hypothetical protein